MTDWPNEPDDGHTHVYDLEPDDDMGVEGAVMCSLCGELSVVEPEPTTADYDDIEADLQRRERNDE